VSNNEPNLDQQIKLHELHKRDPERAHDQHEGFLAAANRAMEASAQIALRTGVIINGGAAVALLYNDTVKAIPGFQRKWQLLPFFI
jgi:hypothetical protein